MPPACRVNESCVEGQGYEIACFFWFAVESLQSEAKPHTLLESLESSSVSKGSNQKICSPPKELARDDSSSWAKHCGSWAVAVESVEGTPPRNEKRERSAEPKLLEV